MRAATLFGAAAALWHALGTSPAAYATFAAPHDDAVKCTREALDSQTFAHAFDLGQRMGLERTIDYALDIQPQEGTAPPTTSTDLLTRRQRQVAELVAEGLTNAAIAIRLFISQRTVEAHVDNILTKLGLHSRAQIAAWIITEQTHTNGGEHQH